MSVSRAPLYYDESLPHGPFATCTCIVLYQESINTLLTVRVRVLLRINLYLTVKEVLFTLNAFLSEPAEGQAMADERQTSH